MVIGFIFSMFTFQHWSQIFVFLINEMGRKLMFSLYQPLPVMSVINGNVSLAKQQALGLLQPCWRVKSGKLLTFLLHCQACSVIIYYQSCCWQKKWCFFGSEPTSDFILITYFLQPRFSNTWQIQTGIRSLFCVQYAEGNAFSLTLLCQVVGFVNHCL